MRTLKSRIKMIGGLLMPDLLQVRGRKSREKPRLALTFDDGPHPENTPRLLDCFAERGIKCTFFVIGNLAEQYPYLIGRMLAEGHEIANHSYTHYGVRKMGEEEYLNDLLRGQQVLDDITGGIPKVVRPPYGIMRRKATFKLMCEGHRHVLWSADSGDCELKEGQSLAAQVAQMPFVDGDIVLMHDDYEHTARDMPEIIADLRRRGYDLVRCCDL